MEPARRQLLGTLLCLAVALSFAVNTALAAVAYRHGADALSVLTYRTTLALIALFVILKLWRVPMTLEPGKRWIALGLGIFMGIQSYGLLGAIQFMPLALAVLTIYLNPLLMGLASWALRLERMTWALGGALVTAFAGLMLALDVWGGGLSAVGVALAAGGALSNVGVMLINRRLVGAFRDSRPVTVHMLATAALTFVAIDLVWGQLPLPADPIGWAAFLGVGAFYAFGVIGVFVAMSIIGPVRSALFANLEPIASVVIGTTLLGQAMSPLQLAGAALVLGAIVFTAWRRGKSAE